MNNYVTGAVIKALREKKKMTQEELAQKIFNQNKACNMAKGKFYVCPVCGNIIHTTGEAVISCCGITLPALEAEETEAISAGSTIGSDSTSTSNGGDSNHALNIEVVEDEYFVTINHPMTKDHYISFGFSY